LPLELDADPTGFDDIELVPAMGGDTDDLQGQKKSSPPPSQVKPEPSSGVGAPARPLPRPLLLDVTPLSLGIATVGGYSQALIPRNSPVPVETSQTFVTSEDHQSMVSIRICQGESRRFEDNTVLGELRLEGLPSEARGEVRVKVTFELDASGILQATAEDVASKRVQRITIQLHGQAQDVRGELRLSGKEGEYRLSRGGTPEGSSS